MALEVFAYHGVVKSWRPAEQKLLDEEDPARRVVLAEIVEEWAGAFEEAVSELRAAAERALHGDGGGADRLG